MDKADLGSVIGKHGQTARAMRILLAGISMRGGCRLMLDIVANPFVEPALPEPPDQLKTTALPD